MICSNPTAIRIPTSRSLTTSDVADLRAYLDSPQAPPYDRLFFLNALCLYGIDTERAAFFGSFNERGLTGAMVIHGDKCHVIGHFDGCLERLADHLRSTRCCIWIEGPTSCVQACLAQFKKRDVYHLQAGTPCRLTRQTLQSVPARSTRCATLDDIPQILSLERQIQGVEQIAECRIRQHIIARRVCLGRAYVAEADSRVVSVAYADVVQPPSAEICEVASAPLYRNRGLGTACVAALCRDLLNQRVDQLFLTYADGNGAAAQIYNKIGFISYGYGRRLRAYIKR